MDVLGCWTREAKMKVFIGRISNLESYPGTHQIVGIPLLCVGTLVRILILIRGYRSMVKLKRFDLLLEQLRSRTPEYKIQFAR